MNKGCLLPLAALLALFIGGGAFISSVVSDPLKALGLAADWNGGVSKWDDKTLRVATIHRSCQKSSSTEFAVASADCDAPENLKIGLLALAKIRATGQPCLDDGVISKSCAARNPPFTGYALVDVVGVNRGDEAIRAQVRYNSTEEAYYVLEEGDALVLRVCRTNSSLVLTKAQFQSVKGC